MDVYRSKANVGLGIEIILDKNKAMLATWIWRFGQEENSLWRRIIALFIRFKKPHCFGIGTYPNQPPFLSNQFRAFLKMVLGLVTIVGKGDRAKLWSDVKVKGRTLKEAFLRCFALAVNKNGIAHDCGAWSVCCWASLVSLCGSFFVGRLLCGLCCSECHGSLCFLVLPIVVDAFVSGVGCPALLFSSFLCW
ncbi:hypothetical protein Ddye_027359 [Dipteronia dyeriana]|uniref:Uncharacterized protein n=1 Tax=Dipteronia dyeriana TaxID=168575 RepID=A0AAD9TNW9_9ROSI|nr:hypothetical protein Ddye_027359 [Dipteronia dyeriana]